MRRSCFLTKGLGLAILAALAVVLVQGSALADPLKSLPAYNGKPAKYVFFFIGDGMANPQRASAEVYLQAVQKPGEVGMTKLAMSRFPAQGMTSTYSLNAVITDSAASGTALACGYKTKSGVISMDPAGKVKYKTIAALAKERGMKVGIISSVDIDHATPATFYANEPTRKNYYNIPKQMCESDFDYFAGGGIKRPEGKKHDQPNLYDLAREKGFATVFVREQFEDLKPGRRVMAFNAYLDNSGALPYEIDRDKSDISLAEFTELGIRLLDNPDGFFMMIEGGKIDWACHANDAGAAIHDTLAFDKAVQAALKFYEKHPSETLIVVTGDHECGGMTIGFAGTKYASFFDKLKNQNLSYQEFEVKLADWKKANKKDPSFEKVMPLVERHFGLRVVSKDELKILKAKAKDGDKEAKISLAMALSEREQAVLETALAQSMLDNKVRSKDEYTYLLYGGYDPFTMALTHTLNNKAGIAWTSFSHTGVPVPTSAIGLGNQLFNGYYDNVDVFKKTAAIMGLGQARTASAQ